MSSPADELDGRRQLGEHEPGEEHGEEHLGQGHEGGDLGAEHAHGRDPRDVGEGGSDDGDDEHRHPPVHDDPAERHACCASAHVEHADEAGEPEGHRADDEAATGERERRHVVVDVVGEQEVEHEADGRAEAPEDADDADAARRR